ncbi:MAG: CinA family protein [Variovorax sp.]
MNKFESTQAAQVGAAPTALAMSTSAPGAAGATNLAVALAQAQSEQTTAADVPALCARLGELLVERCWVLATAESCTGGLIAAACTEAPGSSEWFDRGFVSYSSEAKRTLLGVDPQLIQENGSVSEAVVQAMVEGAVAQSAARVALAVTGVAGPTGGSEEKPVGTVWFGWSVSGNTRCERRLFEGDRQTVRSAAVHYALQEAVTMVQSS